MPSDPELPPLFSRDQALAAGVTRHQIAHRVRTGRWYALRRAMYTDALVHDALTPSGQHLLRVVATLLTRGEEVAASHLSACLVEDWPTPLGGPGPATITSGDLAASARRRPELIVQVATLAPRDVRTARITVAGHTWTGRVTRPARTVADCLRHQLLPDGVAIGDAALRSERVRYEQVCEVLARQEPWPYLARGRQALTLLDPRRESWLESTSFTVLWQLGAPTSEPQVTVRDRRGRFVARVDGWLDDVAVALEADGSGKHLRLATGLPLDDEAGADEVARTVRQSMQAQFERESRLRDLGVVVVRWGTAEITRSPQQVLARVRAACAKGERSGFEGRLTLLPRPSWLPAPGAAPAVPSRSLSARQAASRTPKPA